MSNEKFYLVFRAVRETVPSDGNLIPYNAQTVVKATDAEDACRQVAEAIGSIGGFVAVECEPVALNLTPTRLSLTPSAPDKPPRSS
jgi:hypothetical protein